MKSSIRCFSIFLFIGLLVICSCEKNPSDLVIDQSNEKPEILYIARKLVTQGWGAAVSINIMNAQGGNQKEIISISNGYVKDPYFSNDGEKIVFVMHSDTLGVGENLFTINYDGTDLSRITLTDTTLTYFVPQFIPDALKVIYLARVNNQEIQIRILDIMSKQQTVLVSQTNYWQRPVITLDGKFILYNNIDENVHKIAVDGSSDIKLTDLNYSNQIQISGDGNTVYFVSQIGNQLFDLFSMDLNGNNLNRVTNLNDLSNAYFRISLDGSKIINLTGSPSGYSFDIMNSDGSERKTIPINKSCWDSFEFFPDGKNVIYEVDGDPDHNNDDHIYRIGISGRNMQILSLDKYNHNQFCCFRPEI